MQELSTDLIKKLKKKGINTFFGVIGGACARIIEAIIKSGGKYYPVLNEQAAGYCAHGYYLSTRKTAGIILTTGPGFTNAVSGIAACYYDNVPLVVLIGQVPKTLNVADKFKTKMVGFQELPHLKIGKNLADKIFCINSEKSYKRFSKYSLPKICTGVSIIEISDDTQRLKVKFNANDTKEVKVKKNKKEKINFSKKLSKDIKKTKKPIFLLGAGFSRARELRKNLNFINKLNIPVCLSWGGQEISRKVKKYIGIFGQHSPGIANTYIRNSSIVICLGISLLQHQTGKVQNNFAPKAKIVFVNNNLYECKRAKKQFGKRLIYFNCEISDFLSCFNKSYISNLFYKKGQYLPPLPLIKNQNAPVNILSLIIGKINMNNSIIFSDAGATLSWTYQAANLLKKDCAPIYTSFNLHAMGYANCAAIGAACGSKKDIFVIIGDGSIPMNSQELSWANKFKVKFIIVDNKGYAIIRQTQKQFYNSFFIGSDFLNKKSSLPYFSIKKILKSFNIQTMQTNSNFISKKKLTKFFNKKSSSALIINTLYSADVQQ